MQDKPYFCPNCRSNRVKFSLITSYRQRIIKDAFTGAITDLQEPQELTAADPDIQCLVCDFVGNEMRFIKQAEREPRVASAPPPTYV